MFIFWRVTARLRLAAPLRMTAHLRKIAASPFSVKSEIAAPDLMDDCS